MKNQLQEATDQKLKSYNDGKNRSHEKGKIKIEKQDIKG